MEIKEAEFHDHPSQVICERWVHIAISLCVLWSDRWTDIDKSPTWEIICKFDTHFSCSRSSVFLSPTSHLVPIFFPSFFTTWSSRAHIQSSSCSLCLSWGKQEKEDCWPRQSEKNNIFHGLELSSTRVFTSLFFLQRVERVSLYLDSLRTAFCNMSMGKIVMK